MHDENELMMVSVNKMTGSIIVSLIWTLLVSTLLFGLTGCGGGVGAVGADPIARADFAPPLP